MIVCVKKKKKKEKKKRTGIFRLSHTELYLYRNLFSISKALACHIYANVAGCVRCEES